MYPAFGARSTDLTSIFIAFTLACGPHTVGSEFNSNRKREKREGDGDGQEKERGSREEGEKKDDGREREGMCSVVEHRPSMLVALSVILSTWGKEKKKVFQPFL